MGTWAEFGIESNALMMSMDIGVLSRMIDDRRVVAMQGSLVGDEADKKLLLVIQHATAYMGVFTNKVVALFSHVPQDLRDKMMNLNLVQDDPDTEPDWYGDSKHGGAMDDTFYFDTGDQDINDKTPTSLVDGYDFVGLV